MSENNKLTGPVVAYKGMDKDMRCRGYQFEVGGEYTEDKAVACKSGFHSCLHPLDVFNYYPPNKSRYFVVKADGEVDSKDCGDTKIASTKIKVGAELNIKGMVDAAIKFVFDRVKQTKQSHVNQESSAASATGNRGAASAIGYRGAASAIGYQGAASATGDQGAASATGNQGVASATGDESAASATGDRGTASATGYRGAASATGYQGVASATGYRGAASATGDESIACALGFESRAKGADGCWLVLTERANYPTSHIKGMTCVKVDGEKIKADTWYTLKNGEVVEVSEDG